MTRTVLFAWELGDGLGHVTRLLKIAEKLREADVRCLFAVRHLEPAGRLIRKAGFEVLQAPVARVAPIHGPAGTQPVTTGDILGSIGFSRVDRLAPLVDSWALLIRLAAADLVVTDYAPTANLALYGGPVPWVAIGDGFSLPPFEAEGFMPFRAGPPAFEVDRLLAVVAEVQAARGHPALERLPLLFRGDRRFVVTLPELDPCRGDRTEEAVGPLTLPPRPVEQAPTVDYFAYLSSSFPFTARVLEGLVESKRSGSVFLRDSSPEQRQSWRERGLSVWDHPQDMAAMAAQSATIVHHGGVGTAEQALALGRPQMLVPRHFEQATNARNLGRLGVAVALRSGGRFEVAHVAHALAAATEDGSIRARAADRARVLARRHYRAADRVATACLDLLACHGPAPAGANG